MLTLEDDAAYSDELEEAWEIFAEDGKEDLDLAEEALLALETNPSDTDQIARLFRGLHKFKGNARMMGLPVLESLFHHAEDLAALVRDEGVPITCEMIELLLEVLDRSRAMLNYTLTHRRDVEENQVEDLVQRLSEALERYAHPPSEPAVAAPATDLKDDALYLRTVLEMVRDELECLPHLLAATIANHRTEEADKCAQRIRAIADALGYTADRLGYVNLVAVLRELAEAVESPPSQERSAYISDAVQALWQEMARMEEALCALGVEVHSELSLERGVCSPAQEILQLIPPVYAERAEAVLGHLGQTIELLAGELTPSLDHPLPATLRRLARKAAGLLYSLYPMCVFYKLGPAAYLTLALANLYSQVARGKIPISASLLDITRAYAGALSKAFKRPGNGVVEFDLLTRLIVQVEGMHITHLLSGLEPTLQC